VRVRMANLTMTNHPIHLHGHRFAVTCTDGGWVPESAQRPHATVDVPVGEIRAIDFVADNPGDWAFHCHKSHHTMNAMGHNTRNLIGAKQKQLTKAIRNVAPDYMPMGSAGMAEMGAMEMPLPDNTLPMMTGFGQFGPMEMGGMFSVVKVREGIAAGDYRDPGPYAHPPGTVAHEVASDIGEAPRVQDNAATAKSSARPAAAPGVVLKVIKPGAMSGHTSPH
jgi:manganese oxidase